MAHAVSSPCRWRRPGPLWRRRRPGRRRSRSAGRLCRHSGRQAGGEGFGGGLQGPPLACQQPLAHQQPPVADAAGGTRPTPFSTSDCTSSIPLSKAKPRACAFLASCVRMPSATPVGLVCLKGERVPQGGGGGGQGAVQCTAAGPGATPPAARSAWGHPWPPARMGHAARAAALLITHPHACPDFESIGPQLLDHAPPRLARAPRHKDRVDGWRRASCRRQCRRGPRSHEYQGGAGGALEQGQAATMDSRQVSGRHGRRVVGLMRAPQHTQAGPGRRGTARHRYVCRQCTSAWPLAQSPGSHARVEHGLRSESSPGRLECVKGQLLVNI